MRTFRIDFTQDNPCLDGCVLGRMGEHNATQLVVTPPAEFAENEAVTSYIIAFATGGMIIHSEPFNKAKTLSVPLWQQLTANAVLGVQLEAYDSAGEYIGKSEYISGLRFLPSAGGSDIPADTDNPDFVSEFLKTKHSHENKETLDKFGEDESGALTYNGSTVVGEKGETGYGFYAADYAEAEQKTIMMSMEYIETNGETVKEGDFILEKNTGYVYLAVYITPSVSPRVRMDYLFCSKGTDSKSAYESAVEGGYAGTEEEFAAMLAKVHEHSNKDVLDLFGINTAKTRPTFNNIVLASASDVSSRYAELYQILNNDYYNKTAVDERISSIPKFSISVVDELPTEDISNTTVYFLKDTETSGNLYTEYIYINDGWEILGTQSVDIDLSEYAKTEDLPEFDINEHIEEAAASVNLYQPQTDGWVDDAILASDGVPTYNASTYKAYAVTSEITIKGGTAYTVKPNPFRLSLNDKNKARTYDSSGVALDYMTYTENEDGSVFFTTPENSETLRITVYMPNFGGLATENANDLETVINNFNSSFMLVEGTKAPEVYEPFEKSSYKLKDIALPDKSVNIENVSDETLPIFAKLARKTIVNFGDSIFGNEQPPDDVSTFLAEKTGATVYNCAFGGCRMSQHPTTEYNAFSMFNVACAVSSGDFTLQENAVTSADVTLSDAIKANFARLKTVDFSKVDIITIAYSTNDWNGSVTLDNEENLYDTTTIGGALRTSIEMLLSAYPNLRIFVLSTTWRYWFDENNEYTEDSDTKTNSIGLKLVDYNAKLKEVAEEYNLPFVDDYNIGINKFNRTQYFSTSDGTHHIETGRKLIAEHLAGALASCASDGKDGITPNITIGSVETLESDSEATAEITGDAENPVLNLGIPKGKDGADGYTPVKGTDYFTEADKAEMVEEVAASLDGIPDYWQTALNEGVEAINTAMQTAGYNKSAFLFYSDVHWNYGSQMSPRLLKYLYRHTAMTKTNFGGDIVNDEAADYDTMSYLWNWRNQLKDLPNHHSVVGNHDDGNTTNNLFSEQYVYGYLLAAEETPDIVRGDSGLYYYVDHSPEKTRYLYLDTAYKGVGDEQQAFVKDALLSTPEGWHIVAISHIWHDTVYNGASREVGELNADASILLSMFDSYNSRSGDYADCGGWVEFCIGGHTHLDHDSTSSTGIPIILVATDSQHTGGGASFTLGTDTEASVNGIIADYSNHKIYVVRIGRGESREIEVTNYVASYTNLLDEVGYEVDQEYSTSSQTQRESSGGFDLTGWIELTNGDVFYLKNFVMPDGVTDRSNMVYYFDSNKTWLGSFHCTTGNGQFTPVFGEDGNLTQFTVGSSGWTGRYIRINCTQINETSIITRNEPIE